MPTLYLFADSNLFLHYKSLKQIDWLRLGNCDDIEVVVCRTVQRELDALKDGRAGRRSDRARKAASILLKVAQYGPEAQEAASPRVALNLYRRRRRALAFSVHPMVLSDMAPALTAGSTAWAATPRRAWHPSASSRPTAPLQNELGWHDDRGNLLRFLDDPSIEPTNNRAERALRGAVIARKVSHCSKNAGGADAFSAFTSVIRTLARNGGDHSLVNGLCGVFSGAPVPTPSF